MLVPTDVYRFPSPPFSTSLRDDTSSKPFADRLFDYWRTRLSANSGGASTSTSAATSQLPQAVPNTSTYLILGIPGKGGAMSTGGADRPIDAQQYLQTTGAFAQAKRTATVLDAASLPVPPPNEPVDPSSYGRFFAGKRIYLASDLSLSLGFEGGLRAQVARAGGSCWSFQYGDDDFPADDDDEADDGPAKANDVVVGKLRSRRSATSQGADAWETRRRAEKRLKESDIVIMQVREGWEYWTVRFPFCAFPYELATRMLNGGGCCLTFAGVREFALDRQPPVFLRLHGPLDVAFPARPTLLLSRTVGDRPAGLAATRSRHAASHDRVELRRRGARLRPHLDRAARRTVRGNHDKVDRLCRLCYVGLIACSKSKPNLPD